MVMWRWSCAVALAACAGGGPGASSSAGSRAPGGAGSAAIPSAQPAPSGAGGAAGVALAPPQAGTVSLPSECVTTGVIEASLRPTNVLFLVDRSGSMNCNLPPATTSVQCEQMPMKADPAQLSKWEIVRGVLKAAIAQL